MDKILTYDNNKNIFIENEYSQVAGNNNTISEIFNINRWISPETPSNQVFVFATPLYSTVGGTTNYYAQEVNSIFTNIARPYIKFTFSANQDTLSADTTLIQHKIYRIDYGTYLKNISELEVNNANEEKSIVQTKEKQIITLPDGTKNETILEKIIEQTEKTEKYSTDILYKGREFTNNKYQEILNLLKDPVLEITAKTNTIAGNVYNLFLDEYFKNINSYKKQLFLDKSQYFIATNFIFERNSENLYEDFYRIDSDTKKIISYNAQITYAEETPVYTHTISAGTFSGVTVQGNFFTYFLIPNKPIFQKPYVEGNLTTYSPTFYFDNSDDGNEYLLQVSYEPSFTGTVYTYSFSKEETMLNKEEIVSVGDEDWDTSVKRSNVTRKVSASLKPNKQFWYRIGNKKIITNLFGVKQSVVSFSDTNTAITSQDALSLFVGVESDSPYVNEIAGIQTPTYLNEDNMYTLSGIVSGSIVTGATIQLIYQNNNSIITTTDQTGYYKFTNIESGNYTLKTFYRGYQQDAKNITITGNTSLSFKLKLLWGNNVDTWGKMANENYYL